jgi:hypothetical protein
MDTTQTRDELLAPRSTLAPHRLHELSQSRRSEPGCLLWRKRTEDECSENESQDGAGLLRRERVARSTLDRPDFAVDQPADLPEEFGVSEGLREDANPATRSGNVRAFVELEGAIDVREQRVVLALVRPHPRPESPDEVFEQRLQDLALAREVVMDEARRNPCLGCHGGNGCTGVAVVGEDTSKCSDDLLPAFCPIAGSAHSLVV